MADVGKQYPALSLQSWQAVHNTKDIRGRGHTQTTTKGRHTYLHSCTHKLVHAGRNTQTTNRQIKD